MKKMMTLNGADAIRKKLSRNADMHAFKDIVQTNTSELKTETQRRAPVKTGYLQRSIVMSMDASGLSGNVNTMADYAQMVNDGTRYQAPNPFITDSFYIQKIKFMEDLRRIM